MKVWIVFWAILLMGATFVFEHADMGRYMQAQTELKALSEECAAGAALYFDEAAYAEGDFVFKQAESRKYVEYILQNDGAAQSLRARGDIKYELKFFDDREGYAGGEGVRPGRPAVWLRLAVKTEDFFRLPFLEVRELSRRTLYELPSYLS